MQATNQEKGGPVGDQPTPYRDAAQTYRNAGWVGVLPIPYRTKRLVAKGWTGHTGAWPSSADVQAWCDSDRPDEGGGNIALRLPPDIVGIDVDAYGDKAGAETLAEAVARWGPLPDTWMSTARDDGKSGIRLFRIPEGLRWPGQVGPGIETIHAGHRYTMVWPSAHPEGRIYRWYRPDGLASTAPPRVDELPDLPDAWVIGLTGGETAEQVSIADLSSSEVNGWLLARSEGDMCRAMRTVLDRLLDELRTGSAHESLRRLIGLVRLAEQGHAGLADAIGRAHHAFMATATNPSKGSSQRDEASAQAEWSRSLGGAVRRVLGNASTADTEPVDPCSQPFAGLVPAAAPQAPVSLATVLPTAASAAPIAEPVAEPEPARSEAQQETDDLLALAGAAALPPTPALTPEATQQPLASPPAERERTSWAPRDLTAVLAGERTEPEPCILAREDGRALFYAGKVNGLLGESESGKTWLLLAAVVQQLELGHAVLYVDFEDTADSVVARLLAMGATPELLGPDEGLFHYIAPDESLHALAAEDLAQVLGSADYALIGLDGVNAAMTLLGLDLGSNTDATRFSQVLLKPLARTGAAVVTVDHVGKDKENRGKGGIGAQAKRAMVTGCALAVDVVSPFGRGQTGKLKLTVDKDRPGHVRGFAENSKNAGIAVLESGSDGSVRVRIEVPGGVTSAPAGPFRPTAMMERISRLLSTTDGDLSGKAIEEAVEGRAVTIRAALERLVVEGYVSRHSGPRNAVLHRYEKTFREMSELIGGEAGDGPDDY